VHTSGQDEASVQAQPRRRYRRHSDEFKARVVQACRQPGVSIAAIALQNGLNANLLRRWVAMAEQGSTSTALTRPSTEREQIEPISSFVPVTLPPPASGNGIRVEVRRGDLQISIDWPSRDAAACVLWLRELMG